MKTILLLILFIALLCVIASCLTFVIRRMGWFWINTGVYIKKLDTDQEPESWKKLVEGRRAKIEKWRL